MPVNPEDMIQLLMKTNADQEECLKEKDQTISDLRATVEELRNTVTDLRSTIANLNETLDEFKRKLFWYFQRKSKAGKIQIIENGVAVDYSEEEATKILSEDAVTAIADIKMGDCSATAWGCDLTYDYVKINADYRS